MAPSHLGCCLAQPRHHYVYVTAVTRKTLKAWLSVVMFVEKPGTASALWTPFKLQCITRGKTSGPKFIQVQEYGAFHLSYLFLLSYESSLFWKMGKNLKMKKEKEKTASSNSIVIC